MTDGTTAPGPAVAFDALVVRYGEFVAVDGLSFAAERGELVALLGPNGAGKTSTVEAAEGYRRPSGGSVRVLGLDPVADRAALVPRIGVMLQGGGLYPTLGPHRLLHLFAAYYEHPADPDELLDRVGLRGVATTPTRRLSGGEHQRLALALALVGRPEVLFLDEPTAGVDPAGRIAVRELIATQREAGVCVVLTTHELGEAERLADRVLIVDGGRVRAEGTPAELAAAAHDGAVRFAAPPALDTGALAAAVGPGTVVVEDGPGRYRLDPPPGRPVPDVVAATTAWLAQRGLGVTDLATGRSLEDAYLAIVGERGATDDTDAADPTRPAGPGVARGRGGRGPATGRRRRSSRRGRG